MVYHSGAWRGHWHRVCRTVCIGIRFLVKPDTSRKNQVEKGAKLGWKGVLISLGFGLPIGFGTGFVGTGGGGYIATTGGGHLPDPYDDRKGTLV